MTRAHLIANPEARRVTPALSHVVRAALEAKYKLDTTQTHARDAGVDVARDAVASGAEVIVAFGGDGLINEVVNGIAGTGAALAIIPGGTMNVFARNLGIPNDPLEATDRLLHLPEGASARLVKVGLANDRYFTFACGCGFDAEAAGHVEEHRQTKRRFGEPYFYAAATATFLSSFISRDPFLHIEGDFDPIDGVLAIATNGGPYAYLARLSLKLGAGGEPGLLDLFALEKMEPRRLPMYALGAFVTGDFGAGSHNLRGLESFTVSSQSPFGVHVDGEPLAPATRVECRAAAAEIPVLV
jgi:diacylglycerol kinase family enzyme